ncbi:MAG: tRNA 2-thiouridine(34) synthase MnmA, partial [Patescibacteria group bacterium]
MRKVVKGVKKKVFVGMSGGVDSSVAAALLKVQNFEVVGVFIKVWQPSGEKFASACTWRDERRDAMRVAGQL